MDLPYALLEIIASYLDPGQLLLLPEFLPQRLWTKQCPARYLLREIRERNPELEWREDPSLQLEVLAFLVGYQRDICRVSCAVYNRGTDSFPFEVCAPYSLEDALVMDLTSSGLSSSLGLGSCPAFPFSYEPMDLPDVESLQFMNLFCIDIVHTQLLEECFKGAPLLISWLSCARGSLEEVPLPGLDSRTTDFIKEELRKIYFNDNSGGERAQEQKQQQQQLGDAEAQTALYLATLDMSLLPTFCKLNFIPPSLLVKNFKSLDNFPQSCLLSIMKELNYFLSEEDYFREGLYELLLHDNNKVLKRVLARSPRLVVNALMTLLTSSKELSLKETLIVSACVKEIFEVFELSPGSETQREQQHHLRTLIAESKPLAASSLPRFQHGDMEISLAELFEFDLAQFLSCCANQKMIYNYLRRLPFAEAIRVCQNLLERADGEWQRRVLEDPYTIPEPILMELLDGQSSGSLSPPGSAHCFQMQIREKETYKNFIDQVRFYMQRPENWFKHKAIEAIPAQSYHYDNVPPLGPVTCPIGLQPTFILALCFRSLPRTFAQDISIARLAEKLSFLFPSSSSRMPLQIAMKLNSVAIFQEYAKRDLKQMQSQVAEEKQRGRYWSEDALFLTLLRDSQSTDPSSQTEIPRAMLAHLVSQAPEDSGLEAWLRRLARDSELNSDSDLKTRRLGLGSGAKVLNWITNHWALGSIPCVKPHVLRLQRRHQTTSFSDFLDALLDSLI